MRPSSGRRKWKPKFARLAGKTNRWMSFRRRGGNALKVPSHWVWHADCKACNTQASLKWQKDNWEHVKEYRGTEEYKRYARNNWLVRVYHKTLDWYEDRFKKQDGKCAICGKPERSLGSGRKTKEVLAVDHDHQCCSGDRSCGKCVRGLLCSHCNHLLGSAFDNVEILAAAIDYLNF